jgi:probable rRNA maturation factor
MNVTIDLMNACPDAQPPDPARFQIWAQAALHAAANHTGSNPENEQEVSIRIIDTAESAALNETWRHKQGPTNILSFPFEGFQGTGINLLGDLAICAPLVCQEAQEQQKSEEAHWAHLTVHGVLHLRGYDHLEQGEAEHMESLEIHILESLGYPNPYLQDATGND